jgi:hypothetical protein
MIEDIPLEAGAPPKAAYAVIGSFSFPNAYNGLIVSNLVDKYLI